MKLYKNTKPMVFSSNGDTGIFDIGAGVLEGDTCAQFMIIICRDYVLQTAIKENGFTPKETRRGRRTISRRTMIHADYADDLALPETIAVQANPYGVAYSKYQKALAST